MGIQVVVCLYFYIHRFIVFIFYVKVREYTQDLNFKVSAWDRLATETNVTGKNSFKF